MNGAASFDSNSLNTFSRSTLVGILISAIDHVSLPVKDAALIGLANTNASVIPYVGYPSKGINISGVIAGSTDADLDSRIDSFKAYFNGKDKNLDITYSSSTRRYIATANQITITRQQKALYATFVVSFSCTQPFGRATSSTTALNGTGRTANSYNDNHVFVGSAPFQLPIITITYSAVSGGASYVSWGNNGNGQGITITDQTWVAADVLEIDCMNKTVKKNGVEIDFLGAFPEFPPGSQNMAYADGFTTRTMTENVIYYPMYQ